MTDAFPHTNHAELVTLLTTNKRRTRKSRSFQIVEKTAL